MLGVAAAVKIVVEVVEKVVVIDEVTDVKEVTEVVHELVLVDY